MGKNKIVLIFDDQRNLISIVASIKEVSRMLGITPKSISNCCKGVSIMCKGRYLRYLYPKAGLSALDYFEALDLAQYDEMCGETRYYFTTRYDHPEGRKKISTNEMLLLEKKRRDRVLCQLNEYYGHNLKTLAQYGWFMEMSPDMYFPKMLEQKLDEEKNIEVICKTVLEYYQTHLEKIIEEICDRHLEMSDFIKDSVTLYKSGYIRHSILGILSHVDGICNDKLNRQFFAKERISKDKYIPKIASNLIEVKNDFFKIFITPILSDCPIYAHESNIDKYPGQLTRKFKMPMGALWNR